MKIHRSSFFAWRGRGVIFAACALFGLSACERTQPTPDPAPAPPTPQTYFDHVAPAVHPAVFTYPAEGGLFRKPSAIIVAGNAPTQS